MLSFNPDTCVVSTIPSYFVGKPVTSIGVDIDDGDAVQGGQTIGTVYYDDGTDEPLVLPDDCNGIVLTVNTNKDTTALDIAPETILIMA